MIIHSLRYIQYLFCAGALLAATGSSLKASHFVDDQVEGRSVILAGTALAAPGSFHLFSHGKPGQLLLNGQWLGQEQILPFLKEKLAGEKGVRQVNIYGCEFGKGTKGQAAVQYLQHALGLPIAASDDITGKDGDWELEAGTPAQHSVVLKNYAFNLQYGPTDDFDRDGIANALDLDDDNDGVLDADEMVVRTTCVDNYPNNAVTDVVSSAIFFPTGRELANTYDNNLGTFGGTRGGTAVMNGTVTYQYTVPVNNVTAFRFYSNGGSVLNDGQVTHIGSVKFFDATGALLYQQDDVNIPQASTLTTFVLTFPTPLQGVASFSLTDLADISARTGSAEAIWKDVNLASCTTGPEDIDTDNDGVLNRFDLDSDGDGCPDAQEASVTDSFTNIPFASTGVFNTGGVQPAVLSQVNLSTFKDANANGFDDRLEATTAGSYSGTYTYDRATNPVGAVCITSLDTDGDGIPDNVDIDDDNDGILDTVESGDFCTVNYPNGATTDVISSATLFPVGRDLTNTYDNNLGTFGGTATGTPEMIGTVTYTYATPLNNVTAFRFYSNGGSLLSDGQVTHIASVKFYDALNVLLYQQDDVTIPQASTVTPFVLTFPTPLNGVASFTLTDLSDRSGRTGSAEAVWKDVNLLTCTPQLDIDTDNDGIVNRLDLDSDGDGCPDSLEAAVVTSFPAVQFANINVSNTGGSTAALRSQVAVGTFQDVNNNGFDDRFETAASGVYTGVYIYGNVVNNQIASCTALPVTLISFGAVKSVEGIILDWKTSNEKEFAGFDIERSSNPKNGFASIGYAAGGNSQYRFTDAHAEKGSNYYRLKMNDLDGSYSYSRVISIYQPYGENEHIIFPNPAVGHTMHIFNYFPIGSVRVYDAQGKAVGVKVKNRQDRYEFNIDRHAGQGTYILEYQVGDEVIRRKFTLE